MRMMPFWASLIQLAVVLSSFSVAIVSQIYIVCG
jgi:hypothetical protein